MEAAKAPKPRIVWKDFTPVLVVVFNSLVWYTLTYAMFADAINNLHVSYSEALAIFAVYYVAIAFSGILGAIFWPTRRKEYLAAWMSVGAVVTLLLTTIPSNSVPINIAISLFFGIVAAVGLPSCLACFADVTAVENRGVYGGITWGMIGFCILAFALLIRTLDPFLVFAALALWRALGLVAFILSSRTGAREQPARSPSSFSSILHRREVILYLIPWIMFSLVNFTEAPILERVFGDFSAVIGYVEFAITGLFAIVGGFLADLVGRKRIVITGFIILGIEYAVLSLLSEMPVTWFLYTIFDGVAWGMFASVFFMTLWGDLAGENRREKYYALGGIPYFLGGFLPIIVKPYADMIQTGTAFSLASFFLFLAVLPLMYAPETLPEKTIQQRELKKYVDEAKKFREKSEHKK